jgi:hypothetical protein
MLCVPAVLGGTVATVAGASPESPVPAAPPIEIAAIGRVPSVSGDGAKIVYVAADETTGKDQVWLNDRTAGSETQLTVPVEGMRDGNSRFPVISRDGCTVVIVTELAYDLFRDDDLDARWDVYRTVLPNCPGAGAIGEWELVSTIPGGEPTARNDVAADQSPAVNASGSIVVYARTALPGAGASAPWTSIDAVDLTVARGEPGRTTFAPGLPIELPTTANTYIGQRDPAISDDGQTIAFTTDALIDVVLADIADPNAVDTVTGVWAGGLAATGPAVTQVYAWSRALGADNDSVPIRLVSATRDGKPGADSSAQPAISALGDVVAFSSAAPNLLDGEVVGTQIYRTGFDPDFALTLVSALDGVAGNAPSTQPAVDASGNLVSFVTSATNLMPLSPTHRGTGGDVLLADIGTGIIERLSTRPDGFPATPSGAGPNVSASGRVVAFSTLNAAELSVETALETNGAQIAVVDRPPVLSMTNVDIGTVEVGVDSTQWFTTLQNLGPSSFVPGEIWTPDAGIRITGGSCVVLAPLAPGSSCTINFIVTPLGAGPLGGSVNIRERGGPLTATALVSGSGGVPSIVAAPAGIVLDAATVGASTEPTVVTFVNTGAFAEPIQGLSRGGSQPSDLEILIDGCTGRILQPGETCEVAVAIAPTSDGPRNTIITAITEAGATASTVIDGRGIYAPGIVLDADVIGERRQVTISGLGFPANAIVTIGWTGNDRPIRVGTEPNGSLHLRLLPAPGMSGVQTITIIDPDQHFEPIVSHDVLITADQPRRRRVIDNPTND